MQMGITGRAIFPCLPPRLPTPEWLLGEKREGGEKSREKNGLPRAVGSDPLSSLGFKSEPDFPCDFRLPGVASVLHPYRRPNVPHLQHDLRFLSAIIEPRARLRGNCTLWVIACDKCPECPAFLRDVNGPDLGHRAGIYSPLSISHAYPTRRRVVEKRLWAKLNLHKRPRPTRSLATDLCSSSGTEIVRLEGSCSPRGNSPTFDDYARFHDLDRFVADPSLSYNIPPL